MRVGDKVTVNNGYGRIYTIERFKEVGVIFPVTMAYLKETGERFPVSDLTEVRTNPVIDDPTIHFWNLQLQFMSMDTADLVDLFLSLNPYFNRTKHVKKSYRKCLKWLSDYNLFDLNQDERNCIATTLAIQLSGLA